MGPSGSGKSTLLHCLSGILAPDRGEVWFDRDAHRRDERVGPKHLAPRSVRLCLPVRAARARAHGGGERRIAISARAAYDGRPRSPRPGPGSSGWASTGSNDAAPGSCPAARPRASRWPAVWSPDPRSSSPTSQRVHLDSLTGERVMDLLSAAAREQGTTVVLVTHEPRVAAYADREVIVRDGRVTVDVRGADLMVRLGLRLTPCERARGGVRLAITATRRVDRRGGIAHDPRRTARGATRRTTGTDGWRRVACRSRTAGRSRGSRSPVVAAPWRQLPGQAHRPGRRRRHRTKVAGSTGHSAASGTGRVLRLAGVDSPAGSVPRDALADRFGGKQSRDYRPGALPAPDSLLLIRGLPVDELSHVPDAGRVTSISTASSPGDCSGGCASFGIDANGIILILAVVAGAILFPVLVLIGTATRLSATRREQRFAAMRLVGATPRQIPVVAAVEVEPGGSHRRRRRR